MKFFVIPPIAELDLMKLGTAGYYCLAHLYVKHSHYADYFKKIREEEPEAFILLDNGAAESSLVTPDVLGAVTEELRPNEVIAPDVLFDKNATMTGLDVFIEELNRRGLLGFTSIFFCPQGRTKEEWLECYRYGLKHPLVHTIGLSKIAVPMAWNGVELGEDRLIKESRIDCYDHLLTHGLIQKPLHMLGLGDPTELSHYKDQPLVRSNDSANSIWSGMCRIDWSERDFKRIPTPHDYFDRQIHGKDYSMAVDNIDWLKAQLK